MASVVAVVFYKVMKAPIDSASKAAANSPSDRPSLNLMLKIWTLQHTFPPRIDTGVVSI